MIKSETNRSSPSSGRHTHNYTPFTVSKPLEGEFYWLRRMNTPKADAYCENCAPDNIFSQKNLHEVHWKLYRVSDISDRPFDSDLVGNNGLKDDYARRQERLQREHRERQERNAADSERLQYEREQRLEAKAEMDPPPPYEASFEAAVGIVSSSERL